MWNKFAFVVAAVYAAVLLFSCKQSDVMVNIGTTEDVHPLFARKLTVDGKGYGKTQLTGLSSDQDIYLAKVKVNRVQYTRNVAPVNSGAGKEGDQALAEVVTTNSGETILRYERHWQVSPPTETTLLRNRTNSFWAETELGDKRSFYIDVSATTKNAELKHIGTFCKVWVVVEEEEEDAPEGPELTQGDFEALGNKFDVIYPIETDLLGYEYGGGPEGNRGIDGDDKIHILVYDIYDSGSGGTTYGYFYPGDEFQRGKTYPYSNEAEIFYIDAKMLKSDPDAIYSTLIHEFNHMINFNLKVLVGGDYLSWNTETWYTFRLNTF